MNNKGFAVTGIIYSVLIIFLVMMTTMLFNLQNRKTILDELKLDAVDAVESENNYDYLLSETNALKTLIGDTDISGVSDGTITGSVSAISDNVDELNRDFDGLFLVLQQVQSITVPAGSIKIVTSGITGYVPDDYYAVSNEIGCGASSLIGYKNHTNGFNYSVYNPTGSELTANCTQTILSIKREFMSYTKY